MAMDAAFFQARLWWQEVIGPIGRKKENKKSSKEAHLPLNKYNNIANGHLHGHSDVTEMWEVKTETLDQAKLGSEQITYASIRPELCP